ncbi:SDR family NAD(P)-dependent oxidoreductase [Paucibacter sp. APW11]|uniref:SDR family NAD(P)-dependent oxidoreductase n=1 Tax=Roseateles aquae TaxID=3077235 RepID=A0ABU3PC63_9BURK|nr:SDR family NAD(P)-dependent oxidoreductase [Paucibacter sp. APW11]MDT9000152.1 SDR family NAD(P)-dependent oxidoreductase [Paucibacter sp. APW11]
MDSNTSSGQRLWLVTGASSGIGRAIALQLAAAGDRVIAWGRDAERLAALQAQVPGIVDTGCVDLDDLDALPQALQQGLARWPTLNGLVHCAGIQRERLFDAEGYGAAAIAEELRINLAAPLILTQALLPQLRRQSREPGGARLVLVTSALAHAPKRHAAVYNASKAGLAVFVQSLRAQLQRELQAPALQLMELIPPLVDTPMTAGRGRHKLPPEAVAAALLRTLRRPRLPAQLWVGRAALLPWLLRLAPAQTRRLMLR